MNHRIVGRSSCLARRSRDRRHKFWREKPVVQHSTSPFLLSTVNEVWKGLLRPLLIAVAPLFRLGDTTTPSSQHETKNTELRMSQSQSQSQNDGRGLPTGSASYQSQYPNYDDDIGESLWFHIGDGASVAIKGYRYGIKYSHVGNK